ncbi:MAG: hypothetical protein ACO2PO_09835 [Candidatus Calescibacterium sp.]
MRKMKILHKNGETINLDGNNHTSFTLFLLPCLFSHFLIFFTGTSTYAENLVNLKLLFFKKISKENVFFSTPFTIKNDIAVISQKKIIIFSREKNWKEIEIEIGSSAISEINKSNENSFLFCSDDSNVVKVGKFIEPKIFQLPFPCISPPIQINGKIISVDILGNICVYQDKNSNEKIKNREDNKNKNDLRSEEAKEEEGKLDLECAELTEERKTYEPKILFPFTPKILTIGKFILIPYENKIFAASDDLKIKYPLSEIQNSNFISFLGYENGNLVVATENKVVIFEVFESGDVVKIRKRSEILIKDIYGADFDGKKIAITSGEGIAVIDIEKKQILKKKIKGVIEYSPPKIFGENKILFAARFGEKLGNIFGPRKNSLIIAEYKREKPKIYFTKEIIVDSFPQRLMLDKNKLLFITENGTLYAFSFTR